MTLRTTTKKLTFKEAFFLNGYGKRLPAGDYRVDMEEELLESLSFQAWRRTQASVYLPGKPGITEILILDPREIDEALARDQAGRDRERSGRRAALQAIVRVAADDRRAIERAENEGMLWVNNARTGRLRPISTADFISKARP